MSQDEEWIKVAKLPNCSRAIVLTQLATRALTAASLLAIAAMPIRAQIDDARRFQLEGGYEQGIGQPGLNAPYIYAYYNRPGMFHSSSTFRLAIAPPYVNSELGIRNVFGHYADMGVGISGGGYAYGQNEVYRGDNRRGESFLGHGGGPSLTAYPHLGHIGPVPITGIARISAYYSDYVRSHQTASQFVLPPDQWTGVLRAGVRMGGQEPGLDKSPAMEVSFWGESYLREHRAVYGYGYGGDREVHDKTNLYWSRILFSYKMKNGVRFEAITNFGAGSQIDRFSAYRLGGMLTQNAEFPYVLPGYFSQEIAARRFAHMYLRGGVALDDKKKYTINFFAAGASIAPVIGTDPGGAQHAGAGASFEFTPRKGAFHGMLAYGYSPTALRGDRRGGHGLALSMELNFETTSSRNAALPMRNQTGMRWFLGQ